MNVLKFVFGHRGASNLVKRTAQIFSRFGTHPAKMGARFEGFMDVLDEFRVSPTFPITALPMSRNPKFAHKLLDRGAELAVHAWSHIDLTGLDYEGQKAHMGDAIRLFREHGVPFAGFRAPYLHWNEDTMRVVEDYQYRYSSNQTIWWDVLDKEAMTDEQRNGLARGIEFYRPVMATKMRALPFRRRGFVEIPVSLPDDEIPLDRMYIHDVNYLSRMWMSILGQSHARGELFTLQLHPERIFFFADALRGLLSAARAKESGVWIAKLDEIARWWVDKSKNSATFIREGGRYRVELTMCDGAVAYLREHGTDRLVGPGTIAVDSDKRPCVGVSPGSNRETIQALTDLGYVVEVGVAENDFAVHLGELHTSHYDAIERHRETIEAASHPLVRFGVWPMGNRSALSVTGDIDALTIWDFFHRFRGA